MSVDGDHGEAVLGGIITSHGARPELLVQMLVALVEQLGYVPDSAVPQLADALNLSRADVHGVVSYYHDFRAKAPGKHVVRICHAESCQAMGSRPLTEHAERILGLALGETADEVTLEPVYCLGNCACSPAVMIDGRTYGRVTAEHFDELVAGMGADR